MKLQAVLVFFLGLPFAAWAACQPLDIATATAAIKAQKGSVYEGINPGEPALYAHKFDRVNSIDCKDSLQSCDLSVVYVYISVNRLAPMTVSANCVQDQWVFTLPNDKPAFK